MPPGTILHITHTRFSEWKEIGRTECVLNNLSPIFDKRIPLEYSFSANHMLRFEVYDIDDVGDKEMKDEEHVDLTGIQRVGQEYIGEVLISVHEIVASTSVHKKLHDTSHDPPDELDGSLFVTVDKADSVNNDIIAFRIGSNPATHNRFFSTQGCKSRPPILHNLPQVPGRLLGAGLQFRNAAERTDKGCGVEHVQTQSEHPLLQEGQSAAAARGLRLVSPGFDLNE